MDENRQQACSCRQSPEFAEETLTVGAKIGARAGFSPPRWPDTFPRISGCTMPHLMILRRMWSKLSSTPGYPTLSCVEDFTSSLDPKAFTFELEALGLKLTATRMVDGTIRINQWRMHEYWSNERRVKELWERTMGGSDSNRKIVAEFVVSLDRGT